MRLPTIVLALVAATLSYIQSGCGGVKSCTLIGCSNELQIRLSPPFPSDYTMELVLDKASASFACIGSQVAQTRGNLVVLRCDQSGAAIAAAPAQLKVTVAPIVDLDAGPMTNPSNRTGTFNPTYTTSQPNGPDCEPTCRSATVTPL